MTKSNIEKLPPANCGMMYLLASLMLGLLVPAALTGCQTGNSTHPPVNQSSATNQEITLREGDLVKVSLPGSPSLNSSQIVRKDGIITVPLLGEIQVMGDTPTELDKKLTDLYAPQVTSKEVVVEVQSAPFPVYVTGSVLRPGKIMSDHPITALEAVMDAGGFDNAKANMKKVLVIRKNAGGTKNYTLNLKTVMEGKGGESFYLQPDDILFIPEKFTWF